MYLTLLFRGININICKMNLSPNEVHIQSKRSEDFKVVGPSWHGKGQRIEQLNERKVASEELKEVEAELEFLQRIEL